MRLDERLALLAVAGAAVACLAAAMVGVPGVLVVLLVVLLAARALGGPFAGSASRERLDLALALGVAGFVLVLAQRLRSVLGL